MDPNPVDCHSRLLSCMHYFSYVRFHRAAVTVSDLIAIKTSPHFLHPSLRALRFGCTSLSLSVYVTFLAFKISFFITDYSVLQDLSVLLRKALLLTHWFCQEQFCPLEDSWQCLKTYLVVVSGGRRVRILFTFSGFRLGRPLSILCNRMAPSTKKYLAPKCQ